MKQLILTFVFLSISLASSAQSVNDVLIRDIDVEYVQIIGTKKLLSKQVYIEIDFGQRNRIFSNKDTYVKDENGKQLVLNSMIDALNFMVANGYEFVQAYAFAVDNGQTVYHYLLRKMENQKDLPLSPK
ncbi:hypothetical protein [Dyadobacter alkalitolerans]|uniref:hypothetical protein n=1 Tax=Dyadobacter alkalitolerans TaxID=492736 RepID=UPI00047A632A|nr:hypothetical protein [Dyadobacter alkalitolerans]